MINLFDAPIPFSKRPAKAAAPTRGRFQALQTSYAAADVNRLTEDWMIALLSPDQETRTSLRNLRARSRQLVMNNEYAQRFVRSMREEVIGAHGISMELEFTDDDMVGSDKFNRSVEKAWKQFCQSVSADGKQDFASFAQLWLISMLVDGESFVQKLKGYPYNDSRFAMQLVDADQVDINWQRLKRPGDPEGFNEIRLGVEVDEYRRPVAYWLYEGHPAEFSGVVRLRVEANQLDHAYIMTRPAQTRGVPFLHAIMGKMNQLGQYDNAEVTASRWAACKMALFTSELDAEELPEGASSEGDQEEGRGGATLVSVEPGSVDILPPGLKPEVIDWQHPSHNYESFTMTALRGISAGANMSYPTLTGDLRSVNFSSIRQGILTEREGYQVLQALTVRLLCKPSFAAWIQMAVLTGQVQLPAGMTTADVCNAVLWTPRGWDWVDPKKDVDASVQAIRAGLSDYRTECAKRGKDYKKVFMQRAKENALAKELGLVLDLTSSGAGGVEGDISQEDPERGAEPTRGGGAPPPANAPKRNKPNGHAEGRPQ